MGNNRNLIVLVVVLLVLVGGYVLTRDNREALDTTGGFVELVETTLSTDDVYTVSIAHGGEDDVTVVQRDGTWVVSSHFDAPANVNKVRTLLGNLETVSGELRSDDATVLDAYALDDENAYALRVLDETGNALAAFLVGKRSGSGCFVREPGSNRVFVADHNFLSDFGVWGDEREAPKATGWIDMAVVSLERDAIRSIELETPDGRLMMEKEFVEVEPATVDSMATEAAPDPNAYEWRVTQPERFIASKTRADGVMASMVSMRARDIVGDTVTDQYGLGDEARRATVTMEDGTQMALLFGATSPDDDASIYFQVAGEPLVWSMPNYVADNVFKSAEELKTES